MKRTTVMSLTIWVAAIALSITALAIPPRLVSYQGRITDNLGNPITRNGLSVRFLIYKDSTGGSLMWAEVTSKDVVDGLVTHNLGSLVALPDTLFTKYDALWLEILVDGQPIQPRTRMVGAPRVASINGSAGGTITSDVLIQSNSNGNGLEVSQTGGGRAGRFAIDNAGNSSEALVGVTEGSGTAGLFLSNGGGSAVQGYASGNGYALYGAGGKGVYGVIAGDSDSSKAVHGVITSASPGSYAAAVRGQNLGVGFTGIGVWGSQSGQGWGVYGTADGALGVGVRGSSTTGTGIAGYTTSGVSGSFNGGRVTISGGSDAALGGSTSGYLVMGATGSTNIVVDDNEIMARNNGTTTNLYLQLEGGAVNVGATGGAPTGFVLATQGRTNIDGGNDAVLGTAASGYLMIGTSGSTNMLFDNNEIMARNNGANSELHLQAAGGGVGIGLQGIPIPTGYILAVDGKAIMEEVEVSLSSAWPDYVFDDGYNLMPLAQLEEHIEARGHLPGIPSAEEMDGERIPLGEMQTKLLEKIEELTLHLIAMKKEVSSLNSEKEALKQRLLKLEQDGK